MTVSATSLVPITYNYDSGIADYAITFPFDDDDDIVVTGVFSSGARTGYTNGVDYEIDGTNVSIDTAPSIEPDYLEITRLTERTQNLDLVNLHAFEADSLEGALDRLTYMAQEREEELSRTFRVTPADNLSDDELEVPVAAGKLIGWDATASGLTTYDPATGYTDQVAEQYTVCSNINTDVAAAGSAQTRLIILNSQELTGDLTVPRNVTIECVGAGSIDGAHTLTLNGPFIGCAGCFGSSVTVAGSPVLDHILLQWWEPDAGDGTTDCTDAMNAALALQADNSWGRVFLYAGTYPMTDLDNLANKQGIVVEGVGPENSIIQYADNLTAQLFDITSTSGNKQRFEFRNFQIDGNGKTGTAIKIVKANLSRIQNVTIRNVAGYGVYAEEWWDSTIDRLLLHTVGVASTTPAIKLANYSDADSDTGCNNLGFYDLHVESHPYRALVIADSCRKISFFRHKFHHESGAEPAAPNVVLDCNNVLSGAAAECINNISFFGGNFGNCGSNDLVLTNTGGAVDEGPWGINVTGNQFKGSTGYNIKVEACGGLTVQGNSFATSAADIYLYEGVQDVFYNLNDNSSKNTTRVYYDGGSYTTSPNDNAEIISGAISALCSLMVVDVQGESGDDNLDTINGGVEGREITIKCLNSSRTIVVRNGEGNIKLSGGTDRRLGHANDLLTLIYDGTNWLEKAYSVNEGTETRTGAGAISIDTKVTLIVTTGADALTLADGVEGQEKFIVMKTDGGDGTLTPANFGNGTTITFDGVGDSAHLLFTNSAWHWMGGTATIA